MAFEQDIAKLDKMLDKLENGKLSINDSIKVFEDALILSESCVAEINKNRGKLELLTAQLERLNLDVECEDEQL